jgi:four helix bundle protein
MDRLELEGRSAKFAHDVFHYCETVRRRPPGQHPANQLQRAASAVAANYRASARARSTKEFVAKLGVVNEEADEAVFWFEYIRGTKLALGLEHDRLEEESRALRAIFAASYATARRNLDPL